MSGGRKKPEYSPEQVRDISVAIYKLRLEENGGGGEGAVQRMIAKDKDKGEKLRGRAGAYDALTRVYLEVLGRGSP